MESHLYNITKIYIEPKPTVFPIFQKCNTCKMLTRGHNMKNLNAGNIIKIKRESMTIVKGQTNIKICSINPRYVKK